MVLPITKFIEKAVDDTGMHGWFGAWKQEDLRLSRGLPAAARDRTRRDCYGVKFHVDQASVYVQALDSSETTGPGGVGNEHQPQNTE